MLRVVETNDFNQIAHISLIFQPGSDTAVREVRPFLPLSCFWRPSSLMHLLPCSDRGLTCSFSPAACVS